MFLVELRGDNWLKLSGKDEFIVGSDSGAADLVISDPSISPRHARIFSEGDGWAIEDLESEEGTFVNGRELTYGHPQPLKEGDSVSFGFKEFFLTSQPPLTKLEWEASSAPPPKDKPLSQLSYSEVGSILLEAADSLLKQDHREGFIDSYFSTLERLFSPKLAIISLGDEEFSKGEGFSPKFLEFLLYPVRFQTRSMALRDSQGADDGRAKALYSPIFKGDTLVGYVYILSGEKNSWSHDDFSLFSKLNDYFASALNFRERLQRALEDREVLNLNLVGIAPSMQELKLKLLQMAPKKHPVFVFGEDGVGKSRIARAIHQAGSRRDAPIMTINASTIPKELFEREICGSVQEVNGEKIYRPGKAQLADGGSLLIEEFHHVPLEAQKLLYDLIVDGKILPCGGTEPKKVNVRLLVTSHFSLKELLRNKKIIPELYEIFKNYFLEVPSLRQRKEDIPQLFRAFLARFGEEHGLPTCVVKDEALELLQYHRWKTNIRELREIVARCFDALNPEVPIIDVELMRRVLEEHNRDREAKRVNKLAQKVRELEAKLINEALMAANDDIALAAENLGMSRIALRQKMLELGIG